MRIISVIISILVKVLFVENIIGFLRHICSDQLLFVRVYVNFFMNKLSFFYINDVDVVLVVVVGFTIEHNEIIICSVKLEVHDLHVEIGFTVCMLVPCFYWEHVDAVAFHIGENRIDLPCQLWVLHLQIFDVLMSELDSNRCSLIDLDIFATELIQILEQVLVYVDFGL